MRRRIFYRILCMTILVTIVTSCQKKETHTVSGTIFGTQSRWNEVSVSYDYGETSIDKVPVSKGKFTLSLPKPKANYLQPIGNDMPPFITVSNRDAKGCIPAFFVSTTYDDEMGTALTETNSMMLVYVSLFSSTFNLYQLMYLDKKVKITGSFEEKVENISVKIDLNANFKKGWNTLVVSIRYSLDGDVLITATTGEIHSEAMWMAEFPLDFFNGFFTLEKPEIESIICVDDPATFNDKLWQETYKLLKLELNIKK